MRINVEVEKYEYISFQQKVGIGNVSECIRNYIKTVIQSGDEKEKDIRKHFLKLEQQKKEIDSEYTKVKDRLDAIDAKNKHEEEMRLKKLEEEQKTMSKIKRDTIRAHKEDFLKK